MLVRIIGQAVRRYPWMVAAIVVFQGIQAVCNLFLPRLNADIIDYGVTTGDIGYIWETGGLMLGLAGIQIVSAITAVFFGARFAMSVGRDLRSQVFRTVGTFSENEVQRFGAPSLITRSTNDVQQVQMLVMMASSLMIAAPFMAVGGVFMALSQDVGLSSIIAVAVPLMLTFVIIIVSNMTPHFRRLQVRIDAVNKVLREQLTGIRVVRAFVREREERARFKVANANVTESALLAGRWMAAMFPLVMMVMNLGSVAVMWLGADRVESGATQIGSLTAFLTYLVQILMSVMMATFMFVMYPRAEVSAGRIREVLEVAPAITEPVEPVTTLTTPGLIEFDDVTFSYPGAEEPVLSHISFVAEPGSTTAVIGATGSGKTTLVALAPRLFDATQGEVRIGGVDVKRLAMDTLWSGIGLVPQRPYLFSGTIRSTVAFGKPDATDEEIWAALTTAQAADFVRAMPEGLDTPVSQGGTTVSGGQRQRLSIARALVRKPDVLIFDDSFSALDTATDARLRAALKSAAADTTVLVVAQRVSSIVDADQILVVEDGRIVDRGTHKQLLESSATYQEIVSTQLAAEEQA